MELQAGILDCNFETLEKIFESACLCLAASISCFILVDDKLKEFRHYFLYFYISYFYLHHLCFFSLFWMYCYSLSQRFRLSLLLFVYLLLFLKKKRKACAQTPGFSWSALLAQPQRPFLIKIYSSRALLKNSLKKLFQLFLMYEVIKLCSPLAGEAFSLWFSLSPCLPLAYLLTERPFAVIHIWDLWKVVCFT